MSPAQHGAFPTSPPTSTRTLWLQSIVDTCSLALAGDCAHGRPAHLLSHASRVRERGAALVAYDASFAIGSL